MATTDQGGRGSTQYEMEGTMPKTTETVSYFYDAEVDEALVRAQKVASGVVGFAAEMREKGIHVGLGMPGVCVTCDKPWPCPGSGQ